MKKKDKQVPILVIGSGKDKAIITCGEKKLEEFNDLLKELANKPLLAKRLRR